MRKVISGIVYREKYVVLVRKRGKWIFPGGTLENDETPLKTLKREVDEEAGVRVKAWTSQAVTRMIVGDTYWAVFAVEGEDRPVVKDRKEIEEARWVSIEKALKLLPSLSRSALFVFSVKR